MKQILVIFALLTLAFSENPCKPFGLRFNYGRRIYNSSSPELLALRFNTRQQCDHVDLLINKEARVKCPVTNHTHKLKDNDGKLPLYQTYIHICSLTTEIKFDTSFEYNLVESSQNILGQDIKTKIKDPLNKDQEFRFLHIADWGPMTNETILDSYEPVTPSLVALAKQGKIDCAIINGDIGYEFNSNIQHHEATMQMVQNISSLVPIIVNRGNHEMHSDSNTVAAMFEEYFELYDLQINNATGITVGPVFLAIIDPSNMLYPRDFHKFTKESRFSSLETTKSAVQKAREEGKPIVGVTHYPLICSFPNTGHCIPNEDYNEIQPLYSNLKDFYALLLQQRIPLMLSGHVHAYERSYPLISGYRGKIPSQQVYYAFDSQFFIQVVEGVCGSNTGLDDDAVEGGKIYEPRQFVASHSELHNGYGVFYASPNLLKYEHFELKKGSPLKLYDSFVIDLAPSAEL